MNFNHKRCWPFRPRTVAANVMRSAFVDPSSDAVIIGFDCDMFKVTCLIDSH